MSKDIPNRNELLASLINMPGEATDGTLLDDARKRFLEILNSSSSPSLVEWLFTQLIGPPRTVVQHVVEKEEFVNACAKVCVRHMSREKAANFIEDLKLELGAGATSSEIV